MKAIKTLIVYAMYGIMVGATMYLLVMMTGVHVFSVTPVNIVALFVLSGLIGLLSRLFDGDRLSFIQQLSIHFVATFVLVVAVNAVMHWHFLSTGTWLRFGLIFLAVYFIVWLGWYVQTRLTADSMNAQLQARQQDGK